MTSTPAWLSEMSPMIYMFAAGVAILLLSFCLALARYRRTGDSSELIKIPVMLIGTFLAICGFYVLGMVSLFAPTHLKMIFVFLLAGLVSAYLLAFVAHSVSEQSRKRTMSSYLKYLFLLPLILFWLVFTDGLLQVEGRLMSLAQYLGIAAGWLLAPVLFKRIR